MFFVNFAKIANIDFSLFAEIVKTILVGIVQGVTEWLPISSTGHMILFNELVKIHISKNFFDNMFSIVIQLGSILAVLYLYFDKLNPFSLKKGMAQRKATLSLWGKIVLACVPAAVIGLLLDDFIHEKLYGPLVVAATLILYGLLFLLINDKNSKANIDNFSDLNYKTALLIGAFQVLALIPGTSRSGATILGAIILGASRHIAAEFSFFLAIPVMFGASMYKILKYFLTSGIPSSYELLILFVGTLTAFIVSVFSIKFLMNFIKKHSFKAFGYYRIALGIVVILFFSLIK